MHLKRLLSDHNSRTRSLAKALTWRVTATVTTILITYAITGEVQTAMAIGGIEFVVKFFVYYGHERIWSFVK